MNKCIVSFSSHGRENYNKAMLGLIRSTKSEYYGQPVWNGDLMMYSFDGYIDEYLGVKIEQGKSLYYPQPKAFQCYNNAEVPYQFKLAMIQRAREAGYEQVIWCDSTIRLVKNLQPLLDIANRQGVVVFNNLGHGLSPYITDVALSNLGLPNDTEKIKHIPSIMACAMIFDFSNKMAVDIFEEWVKHSQNGTSFQNGYGSTRPEFKAHRHDQAIISYLIYKRGIKFLPYGNLVYPPHDDTKEYGTDIYFVNKGV